MCHESIICRAVEVQNGENCPGNFCVIPFPLSWCAVKEEGFFCVRRKSCLFSYFFSWVNARKKGRLRFSEKSIPKNWDTFDPTHHLPILLMYLRSTLELGADICPFVRLSGKL